MEDYRNHQKWLEQYPNLGVYRYTGLNQNGIFYGPHIERLAANYRNVFFKTATNTALDIDNPNHLKDSFQIMKLVHHYLPNTIIPTEISYDYGILSYCQHLLQILQYMIEYNQTKKNIQLNDNIQLIEDNITMLLSQVDPNLVKKYFPDFIIE